MLIGKFIQKQIVLLFEIIKALLFLESIFSGKEETYFCFRDNITDSKGMFQPADISEKAEEMQKKNGYDPNRTEKLFTCEKEVVDTDNREPHEKVMMMKATGPKQPDSESDSLYSCERTYKENTRPGLKASFNFPPLFREVGRPKPISLKSGKKHTCLPLLAVEKTAGT